ncbi:MAG: hypothetical protein FJZ87_03375 [Chloroflexi bacterium]|nr:hypothetical protein [Chloroflexota bacterium]
MKTNKLLKSITDLSKGDWRTLYREFSSPITSLDCGRKCAPHNPGGKPFCCDICHAVPAAYEIEWSYFQLHTNLWHVYRGDECGQGSDGENPADSLPEHMLLLACLGPDRCQREYRALSCRQFPFFPYVSSDYRFLGLACEWEWQDRCWVMSHLHKVSQAYRRQFIEIHDRLFSLFQEVFEDYARHSERLRAYHRVKGRRFPLLHRNHGDYLVSPGSERMQRVIPRTLPKHGNYRR